MVKKVFTTGDVAKALSVAPRTVAKWVDLGKLKAHRVAKHRRILRQDLLAFITSNGMPLPPELRGSPMTAVYVLSPLDNFTIDPIAGLQRPGLVVKAFTSAFALGQALADVGPDWLVVDSCIGQAERQAVVASVSANKDLLQATRIVYVAQEDEHLSDDGVNGDLSSCLYLRKPVTCQDLLSLIRLEAN